MADKKNKSVKYVEPASYFSKEMRKAAGIGEYAKDAKNKASSKPSTKKK